MEDKEPTEEKEAKSKQSDLFQWMSFPDAKDEEYDFYELLDQLVRAFTADSSLMDVECGLALDVG